MPWRTVMDMEAESMSEMKVNELEHVGLNGSLYIPSPCYALSSFSYVNFFFQFYRKVSRSILCSCTFIM